MIELRQLNKLLIAIFPSIIIRILSISIFLSVFNFGKIDYDNSMFIATVIVIPFMFLVQGVLCALTKTNVYVSFLASIISFLYMATIYIDKSSIIGVIYYLIIGYTTYLITYIFKRKITFKLQK